MSKQTINLGTAPTGVGGDTPRSAFTKAQSNIDELYAALGALGNPAVLPAALPIAQGGTGGTTQASARNGLGLGTAAVAAIVGTVSQSPGVPPALMEYINNSNGEAWKFACGAVIMITTGVRSIVVGTPVGTASAMYYPGAPSSGSNRPVSVVGTPFDWLTIDGGAGLNFAVPVGSPQAGTYRQFYHLSLTANSAQNYTYSYLSIGRWY